MIPALMERDQPLHPIIDSTPFLRGSPIQTTPFLVDLPFLPIDGDLLPLAGCKHGVLLVLRPDSKARPLLTEKPHRSTQRSVGLYQMLALSILESQSTVTSSRPPPNALREFLV